VSDRLLAASLLAYGGGVFAADAGWGPAPGLLAGLALGATLVVGASVRSRPRRAIAAGLVLLAALGALRLELRLASAREDLARWERGGETRPHRLEARVVSRRTSRWGLEAELAGVRPLANEEEPGLWGPGKDAEIVPRRLLLSVSTDEAGERAERLLLEGARVRIVARLSPIAGTRNPGSVDRARTWARRGVAIGGRLVDPSWIVAVGEPRAGPPSLRRRVLDRVAPRLSEHAGGSLALALVLGERSALAPETEAAVRDLGLAHLVAISGLHVGLVGGGAGFLALCLTGRAPGIRRVFAMLLGAAVAVGYAGLSGAGPAVQRAAIVFVGGALAAALHRDLVFGRALTAAALGLSVLEPAWLFDLGARLSFSACAGIAFVARAAGGGAAPGTDGTFGLREAIRLSLGTTLAASFATAPWIVWAGLDLAPWSPVSNLVAVPAMSAVVLPGALAAVGAAAAGVPAWVEPCLGPVALFEYAVVLLGERSPPLGGLDRLGRVGLACGAGLGLLLCRRGALGGATVLWAGLAVLGSPPGPGPGGFPDRPRVVYLDVGQGDAALIEGRNGRVLVDAGRAPFSSARAGRVERAVRALGGRRLDVLVVTHGDADHLGAAPSLIERLSVGALWLPAAGRSADPRLRRLAAEAARHGVPVRWLAAGDRVELEGLAFEVLGPVSQGPAPRSVRSRSSNEASLVLRVRVGGVRHLLTADIGTETEKELLGRIPDLRADVLKVAHHGSRGGSHPGFLAAVSPRVAVVSGPCRPRRGLPSPDVLARLQSSGTRLAWTGRDGAVAIGGREGELVVARWSTQRRCPSDPERAASQAPRLSADEARRALLDEGALGLSRVLGPAQGLSELFLTGIGILKAHSLELSHAGERRAHGERGIRRDPVRDLEHPGHQAVRGHELVQQPDAQRVLGVDRLGRVEEVVRVDGIDLPGQGDGGLTGGIEPQGDLL